MKGVWEIEELLKEIPFPLLCFALLCWKAEGLGESIVPLSRKWSSCFKRKIFLGNHARVSKLVEEIKSYRFWLITSIYSGSRSPYLLKKPPPLPPLPTFSLTSIRIEDDDCFHCLTTLWNTQHWSKAVCMQSPRVIVLAMVKTQFNARSLASADDPVFPHLHKCLECLTDLLSNG